MARTFSVPIIGQSAASGAQVIDGSLKFDDDASNQLKRTPTVDGNKKTWTWSGWVKRTLLGSEQVIFGVTTASNNYAQIYIDSSDQLTLGVNTSSIGNNYIVSTRLLRDTGWYHIVAVFDSSDSTQADRLKLYVNGERITSFSASSISLSENTDSPINDNVQHVFSGKEPYGSGQQLDGHLSQCYLIDGQALTPDSFGFTDPLTNTWKPKKFNVAKADDTILVGSPTYASSDFKTEGDKTSDQTSLSFGAWTSYTGAETKIFKNSTDTVFTLNLYLTGGTTDRLLWYSNNLIDWTFVGNTNPNRYYQLSGYKYYATSEGSGSTTLEAISKNGPNSFYLPFDGNSPIGHDKSVNGNDYTPVNFGGSVALDNPIVSGARPILNTLPGGTQAGVDVFGSRENIIYAVTVSNPGSGNKYYLDGVEAPTLSNLVRGATYTFDQSDSSNSTHPLVFGSTAEGNNFARGANYGSISAGTAGAATTITIPYDAPETLYYHCSSHSGMGGSIVGIHTDETKADQYASNCVFALPIVGDKEDVSASIACTMSNASITNSGVDFVTSHSNFYGASGDFTGASSDALYTGDDDTKFKMEEEDFTVECWVYSTSSSGTQNVCQIYGTGGKYYGIYWNGSSLLFYVTGTGGPGDVSAGDMVFGKSRWYHLALVRNGSTLKGYVDGVEVASDSITSDIDETGYQAYVGRHSPANNGFTGYIQDFRVYKGVAKYTSDFVVSSPSPDILPDTPSGVSGSSKLAKITDGAVSFDGSGDYLLGGTSSDFNLGTGDFTIEGYIHPTSASGTQGIMGIGNAVSPACQIFYNVSNSQKVRFNVTDGTAIESTGTALVNAWSHFAVVREGTGTNETKIYINGKLEAQGTISTNLTETTLQIGRPNTTSGSEYFSGFISNFRVIKGTALYTSNFTPPTAPLTDVTNTKLLCNQSPTSGNFAAVSPATFSNDGTAWSSGVTFSPGVLSSSRGADKAFNGTIANNASTTSNNPALLTASFSTNLTSVTSLRIWSGSNTSNAYINGASGSTVSITANNWTDLSSLASGASGTISSISVVTAGDNAQLAAVEVNGCILVDNFLGEAILRAGNSEATNFNPFNTDINTVRGQESGYATLNPLDSNLGSNLRDGNLQAVGSSNWSAGHARGSIALTSGKWFWESTYSAGSSTLQFGFANTSASLTETYGTVPVNSWTYYFPNSSILYPSGGVSNYFASGASLGDTIGCALDMDNKTWQFFKNGAGGAVYTLPETRSASTQTIKELYPWVGSYNGTQDINFGQKPFKFSPPDGFQPLNAANTRPVNVISRPEQYVGITTWTGNATTGRVITGLNFNDKPDLIWIKNRGEAIDHTLYDSVRGFGANKELTPNGQYSEGQTGSGKPNSNAWGYVNSNTRNGFVVNNGTSGQSLVNNNNIDYVAWCWKAGGQSGNFNIDHVGYSTAGDAAMSIADQNTTGYNTDQNWGSGATGEINPGGGALESGCFNGNFSDNINSYWGDTSKAITYTFNNLPFKKLRFYAVGSSISSSYVKFNGVAQTQAKIGLTNLKFGWFDAVDVPSPLNKIEVYTAGSSDFLSLYAVEVDGKILVNSNVTPPNLPSIPATGASVGTEQGFSIVTYTGTGSAGTIPHRLTQDPEFVIFKQRNNEDDWRIFHKFLDDDEPQDYYLMLQSANGKSADQNQSFMNRVPPTGPVIHLGTDSAINGSSTTMVAYSWHSVPGLQKFGFYNGNGNAVGPFIELGFKPAIVWVKRTDSTTDNWYINDSTRDPFNVTGSSLKANLARAEATTGASFSATWDILSNGFKLRDSGTGSNTSGVRYIYCAWAEAPSVNLYGGGANAR